MIDDFKALIPESLLSLSGAVFYSGKVAFSTPSPLYIVGLNPGGSSLLQAKDTVQTHTDMVLREKPDDWSEYQDESWWEGHAPGRSGMQPRVLHLLRRVELDPQKVPASNLVFVRSSRERDIKKQSKQLAELCWPFHRAVIGQLGVRVVLCFGKTAGTLVRTQLNASTLIQVFRENNKRRWESCSYKTPNGVAVVVATHPSIADWTKPETDPSQLVLDVLQW